MPRTTAPTDTTTTTTTAPTKKRSIGKKDTSSSTTRRCLVTGGAGFLGRHLVEALVNAGNYDVTVFDLREPSPETAVSGVHYIAGDLRKPEDLAAVCTGMDVVFHTATAAPTGNNTYNKTLMQAVNVDGTKNVINACISAQVPALVYTSSASVVFDGKPLNLASDKTTPYASKPLDFYTETKIEGEKLILEANGSTNTTGKAKPNNNKNGGAYQLATIALRPSGIFGEYDMVAVPTILKKAKQGKMKYIVGDGKSMMDWTYAGNVASAHLCAADVLLLHSPPSSTTKKKSNAAGRAFFITNDDPRGFWEFIGDIVVPLGYQGPCIHMPFWFVFLIACIMSYIVAPLASLLGRHIETDMTPSRAVIATTNRTFSCNEAKKVLGYVPHVSYEEGVKRTLEYFKGHKVLGAGGGGKSGGGKRRGSKRA
jgi:nucleoside-diphosphate-sugar epimerase